MQNSGSKFLSPTRWVVMGVSGAGKSEIGSRLAARLGIEYIEGDDCHTPGNVAKMAAGMALDDTDRLEWLQILEARIAAATTSGASLVLSCSALKRRYRDLLRQGDPGLVFIYLAGARELIASRMQARTNHFMPLALLDSQFRDLEPPQPDERAIPVSINNGPEELINEVLQQYAAL